jgi:hypothetical protein
MPVHAFVVDAGKLELSVRVDERIDEKIPPWQDVLRAIAPVDPHRDAQVSGNDWRQIALGVWGGVAIAPRSGRVYSVTADTSRSRSRSSRRG